MDSTPRPHSPRQSLEAAPLESRTGAYFGAALTILWMATAALMWRNHINDPFNPLLEATARYGHNSEGALQVGLLAISIELAIAIVILRPWSRPTIGHSVVGLLLALPWTMLSLMMTMHAGGIIAIHGLWMLALCLYFFVLLIAAARAPAG